MSICLIEHFLCNVCFIKIGSKLSSVLLPCLLPIFMKQTLAITIDETFNFTLPGQNEIWVKFEQLCPKHDGVKWLRKNIFEIPPCAKPFSDPWIYFIDRRLFHKIANSVTKMALFANEGISKKNLYGLCRYDN